jgi:hypothetical protein
VERLENGQRYILLLRREQRLEGHLQGPWSQRRSNEYFYQFNETTGACEGKVTGLIEIDGARYYAINGVAKSGWWNLTDADGNNSYYYFDKETFKGLNGPSRAFFENVTYTFDNGKLLKGEWLDNRSRNQVLLWADIRTGKMVYG